MKKILYSGLFLILIFFNIYPLELTLKNKVEIDSPKIYLKDIVKENIDKNIILANSPKPGYKRYLLKRVLNNKLIKKNISLKGKYKVEIKRKSYLLDWSKVETKLKSYLNKNIKDKFSYKIKSYKRDIKLPGKNYNLKITTNKNLKGYTILYLHIETENKEKRVALTVDISKYKKVVSAVRNIERHKKITLEDIEYKEKNIADIHRKFFTDIKNVAGKRATRDIFSNNVITANYIEDVPEIKRGQFIKAIYEKGKLSVNMRAISLDKGYKGQTIKIRLTETNKEFSAEVVKKGVVKIGDRL